MSLSTAAPSSMDAATNVADLTPLPGLEGLPPLNFGDPSTLPTDSRAGVVIGIAVLGMIIATTAVSLRLYTRYFIVGHVGVDDYVAILSLVFLTGVVVTQFLNVQSGLGTHIWQLDTPAALSPYLRDFYFGLLFYNVALLFIKLTFLFQYYRVVAQVRNLKMAYIVFIFLIGGWTIAQIFVILFLCVPISKFWDPSLPGTCSNNPVQLDLNAIGNIVTDFIVLVLPLPVLLRLNLKAAQKWALIGVFCLGFFTCGVSIIRRILALKFRPDFTYNSVDVAAWSLAELTSGITCAALPTLKPFLSRYFPTLRSRIMKYAGYRKTADGTHKTGASSTFGLSGNRSRARSMSKTVSVALGSVQRQQDLEADLWRDSDESHELKDQSNNERRIVAQRPPGGPLTSNSTTTVNKIRSPHEFSRTPSASKRPATQWPTEYPNGSFTTVVGCEEAQSRSGSSASFGPSKPPAIRVKTSVRIETVHEVPPSEQQNFI